MGRRSSDKPESQPDSNGGSEGDYISLQAPPMINLLTAGLCHSQRIIDCNMSHVSQNKSHPSISAYTSSASNDHPFQQPKHTKSWLAFFSIFCAIGTTCFFATTSTPHIHNKECHSFVARVSNDCEQVNGLLMTPWMKSATNSNLLQLLRRTLHTSKC